MSLSNEDVAARVGRYLSMQYQTEVEVKDVQRIFGGASRETWRIVAIYNKDTSRIERGLIVRRDPTSSLIDTQRSLEYNAYLSIYPTEVPVPEALFLEEDREWLGQPFSVMAEITGCQTAVQELDADTKRRLGLQMYSILGKLARVDPVEFGFDLFLDVPQPADCAQRELDYWAAVIKTDQIHPHPVAAAAVRWLRSHMPPPAQRVVVVHGDYRQGNFLFDPKAGIQGILDWEMCHLGDPLEDLAWSMDPVWSWDEFDKAGYLIHHQEAIDCWESMSGLKVDPQAFRWWRIFAAVKGMAIWISSAEDFLNGESHDPILATAGWMVGDRQSRVLIDYLSPHSNHVLGTQIQQTETKKS